MNTISHSPTYNLKAVLKETGLSADVLRAWERRYQLPMPHRTQGGHRLYSEYDIETVKWLRARQEEGLSISRAVKLWRKIVASGRDPLEDSSPAGAAQIPDLSPAASSHIETLRRNWLKACLEFDERTADEVLTQAFAMYPVETVCIEILQRGMSVIGNEWYINKVSVQQEHFISAQAIRRLETLLTASPRPTREQTVLVVCPPGEWHTFPALLLSLLLRRRGIDVVYLGANIPVEQLDETAESIHPDLIILSAQRLSTAATVRSVALAFQGKEIPLAYGGRIFICVPELRERIPAHYLGESLEGSLNPIEQLLLAPPNIPDVIGVDESYQELVRLYQEKRPRIEIRLSELMQKRGLEVEYLTEANTFFGNELSAALELGSPAFMQDDLEWVKGLLTGRRIPADQLLPYLAAYRQILQEELGEIAAPITDWIATYLEQNGFTSL